MTAEARADGLRRQHRRQQGRPFAAFDRRLVPPRAAQAGQGFGQGRAGLALPQRFGRRQHLSRGNRGVEQGAGRRAFRHQHDEARRRGVEPVDQGHRALGIARILRLHRTDACAQGLQAGDGLEAAQVLAIEASRRVEQIGARLAQGAQRVLQQRQQIDRAEATVDRRAERAQQRGRGRVDQRLACRIVDVDVPALELGGDAARQLAIGRDQRGRPPLRVQRLAQRQGDHGRLLVRTRAVDTRDVIERRGIRPRPGLAGFGRPHQFRHQDPPRPVAAAAGPVRHGSPLDAEAGEQFVQSELRMGGIEPTPALLVDLPIESGQHDDALRQPGDDAQQFARGRLRSGRARGDHRRAGRRRLPARGPGPDGAAAPFNGIDLAALGQHGRPRGADDFQEGEGASPMLGEIAGDEIGEAAEVDALDRQLVEQAAQFARELERLRRRLGDRMALVVAEGRHELGQQGLARRGVDGRRQGERGVVARRQVPLAVVDVAQRRHARQDRGRPPGRAQESLAQRSHRAPRRHQDQDIRQGQRIAAVLGQHALRELVGEAMVDADGEDAVHPSRRSAWARAAGVPM